MTLNPKKLPRTVLKRFDSTFAVQNFLGFDSGSWVQGANPLKEMVGTRRLELLTSTVSNFEVNQQQPFACLTFPILLTLKTTKNSLVLLTNW
jgi:hypothetical protein